METEAQRGYGACPKSQSSIAGTHWENSTNRAVIITAAAVVLLLFFLLRERI